MKKKQKRNRAKYESMTLCPDSDFGQAVLHEAIQDGWEPIMSWVEYVDGQPYSNHIALRRKRAQTAKRTS